MFYAQASQGGCHKCFQTMSTSGHKHVYLFYELPYWDGQLWNQGPFVVEKSRVWRVGYGRLARLHLQPVLQLVGLRRHEKTHGDGAQGHQQAQSDGETWKPQLDRGFGRTPAHRFTFIHGIGGSIHAAILHEGGVSTQGKTNVVVGVSHQSAV